MMCVLCLPRRIECYVIMENDLLGTNKEKTTEEGLKGRVPEEREKKREKELLQNIFHQLGMLSWD